MLIKYIKKLKLYIYLIFGNKDSESFKIFLRDKWKNNKTSKKGNGIILVDLFHHYPFIYFWSYLTNILSKKKKLKIKYFYFPLYENFTSKFPIFKKNLLSIYKSFNVEKGLDERDFKIDNSIELEGIKLYSKIKTKMQLVNFKYKGIHIGDLIYDSYLRGFFKHTVDLKDKRLFVLFLRALKNFKQIEIYLKKNNVQLIIPSHIQYFQYAMLVRIACKKKIKVLKLHSSDWGNSKFRLQKINNKFPSEMAIDYIYFKKIFKKLKNKKQKYNLGKKALKLRISGNFDKNLSYMKKSSFYKKNNSKNKLFDYLKGKKIIVVYCHCFFDAPHKYRNMIFPDFYEQVMYLLKLSKEYRDFIWIFKRHPNELPENNETFNKLFRDDKNVIFIKNELNNLDFVNLKIKLAITDHGTVAHELAYFKIPVINTGDNPQINYDFNLHAKNKINLSYLVRNILKKKKKIKFNKNDLYEFIYMYYLYYKNIHSETKFKLDKCLATKNKEFNESSNVFNFYISNSSFAEKNLTSYIENFVNKNKI